MAEGVKSALSDQESASKRRQARPPFGQNSSAKKVLNEGGIIDPAFFANYITLEIPVSCGSKVGKVYAFFHKSHMDPHLTDIYKRTLSGYIDKKKWIESKNGDVGPTVAIARMIECGDYTDFLQIFKNRNFELKPMEHVLLVVEDGKYRHLFPIDDLCAFRNAEQLGIIGYSILEALKEKLNGFSSIGEEQRKAAMEWIIAEERKKMSSEWIGEDDEHFNAKAFRALLGFKEKGGCRVRSIEGVTLDEKTIVVLEGFLQEIGKRIDKKFDSNEVIDLDDEVGGVVESRETEETTNDKQSTSEESTIPMVEPIISTSIQMGQTETQ